MLVKAAHKNLESSSKSRFKKFLFITTVLGACLVIIALVMVYLLLFKPEGSQVEEEDNANPIFGILPEPSILAYSAINLDEVTLMSSIDESGLSDASKNIGVYRIDDISEELQEKAVNIAVMLAMSQQDSLNEEISWKSEEYELTFDRNENEIQYRSKREFPTSPSSLPSEDKAQKIAEDKLKDLNLWHFSGAEYDVKVSYFYVIGQEMIEVETKVDEGIYRLSFVRRVNDMPLITSSSDTGEIIVDIDINEEVRRIIYRPVRFLADVKGSYPIISSRLALERTLAHEATPATGFNISEVSDITINDVSLVYYYSGEDYLQPMYEFDCKAEYDGFKDEVRLYLPAIQDQYLLNR